jgi:transcriptional regulator with XRE-family HTH domain
MNEAAQDQLPKILKQARELRGFSLRSAAAKAEISGTYLSQLEAAAIKEPSPHVLYKLANVYGISYADLMRAAGYVVPNSDERSSKPSTSSVLDVALRTSLPLTDKEKDALAEYLAWYRSRHGHPPEEQ